MDLKKQTKEQLKDICDDKGLQYSVTDTKTTLVEKIEVFNSIEAETVSVDIVLGGELTLNSGDNTLLDVAAGKAEVEKTFTAEVEKYHVKYKAKQRWIDLGEFSTLKEMKKAVKRCGSQEVDITPIIKK